jgi:YVTN family beta-propeller protein
MLPQTPVPGVAPGAIAFLSQEKKSSSILIQDSTGKTLASFLLAKDVGPFVYSKTANKLFVLQTGKKHMHSVNVINLTTNQIEKEIPVGSGDVANIFLSEDGRLLYCQTGGVWLNLIAPGYYHGHTLKPPYQPEVAVIDTASNQINSTYNWFGDFGNKIRGDWYYSDQILTLGNHGELIAVVKAVNFTGKKPVKQSIVSYSGVSNRPTFMVDFDGSLQDVMLSSDKKLLFVAVDGKEKVPGSLQIINIEKGTTTFHDLTDRPSAFARLGSKQETWLLSGEEMRGLTDVGEFDGRKILLNKPRKPEERTAGEEPSFIDGFPGDTISLGDDYAAILITNKKGASKHKVAMINLKLLEVAAILPTMSTGEKVGLMTLRVTGSVLATAAGASAAYNMGGGAYTVFVPNFSFQKESLAARPDGRTLYALDLDGNKVTVIDVQTATILKRISVRSDVSRITAKSDGKLLCWGGTKVQHINMDTNELEN